MIDYHIWYNIVECFLVPDWLFFDVNPMLVLRLQIFEVAHSPFKSGAWYTFLQQTLLQRKTQAARRSKCKKRTPNYMRPTYSSNAAIYLLHHPLRPKRLRCSPREELWCPLQKMYRRGQTKAIIGKIQISTIKINQERISRIIQRGRMVTCPLFHAPNGCLARKAPKD